MSLGRRPLTSATCHDESDSAVRSLLLRPASTRRPLGELQDLLVRLRVHLREYMTRSFAGLYEIGRVVLDLCAALCDSGRTSRNGGRGEISVTVW